MTVSVYTESVQTKVSLAEPKPSREQPAPIETENAYDTLSPHTKV